MNRVILKYPLQLGLNVIKMRAGAQIIHVGQQLGVVMIWALCDKPAKDSFRELEVVGTGQEINWDDESYEYIGTAHMSSGLVWHVIEHTNP